MKETNLCMHKNYVLVKKKQPVVCETCPDGDTTSNKLVLTSKCKFQKAFMTFVNVKIYYAGLTITVLKHAHKLKHK